MIKTKCIICDKEIVKPKVGQLCCDNKECKDEFNYNQIELWKMENPDKVKEMNERSYNVHKMKNMGLIE